MSVPPAAVGELLLPDLAAVRDLATFVGRAKRVDPDGACRLVARGEILAGYVAPVHGGGGPTVLGLRALRLAAPAQLDATVALAALADRFARLERTAGESGPVALPVPPATVLTASWAGVTPGRGPWEPAGALAPDGLRRVAASGVAELAGYGEVPAATAARHRAEVWGRPLDPRLPGLPAGIAFGAEALGFLGGPASEPVPVHRCGPWLRLTTRAGYLLSRSPLLG